MCNCRSAPTNMAAEMLKALDWVYVTGWPNRAADFVTAMQNFEACKGRRGPFSKFEDFALSLWAAYGAQYGDEVAGHLAVIFLVLLEDLLCSGDDKGCVLPEPCGER